MALRTDNVVVGAGIVGCAVAYELARRGRSVTVVDDRAPGMGATQAAAGILAPFIEARHDGPLLELTARSLGLYDAFVARVRTDSQREVPYQRTGTLDVALDRESFAILQKTFARLESHRVPAELLDAAAVRRCEPQLTSDAAGGLLIPAHGFVAAGPLTNALHTAAERLGASFVHARRVTNISPGDRLTVQTAGPDAQTFEADHVIVAAGSWAGSIRVEGAGASVPVRPIRGQLLHLQWPGSALRRVTWSERCYVVPWDDGTVLVGATEEDAGFDERTTLAGIQDLIDAACDLLPHAWGASLLSAKVGLRPGTPDHVPVIGWSQRLPNLMYATGHFRSGILLAPLTGELVANAIEGRADPMLELTRPQRFGDL